MRAQAHKEVPMQQRGQENCVVSGGMMGKRSKQIGDGGLEDKLGTTHCEEGTGEPGQALLLPRGKWWIILFINRAFEKTHHCESL